VALTYQQTGYAGANIVYDAQTITAVAESFNKANGALGPDLSWVRPAIFTHGFPFQVNANQCRITANVAGTYEDIAIPTPSVDTPNLTVTSTTTAISHTGSAAFVADCGGITRFQLLDGGTNYRGYAFGVGRNNTFIPGVDLWHFLLFRVNRVGDHVLIASDFQPLANITLPGTLTFTASGPDMNAVFTHAGSGPPFNVSVSDSVYTDGITVLGGSIVVTGSDTASIDIDNWGVTGDDANIVPDPRGFLWIKNSDVASKTVAVTVPGFRAAVPYPDVNVTLPAGEQRLIGPLVPELATVAGGRPLVAVNYSPNVTGVTAAAVRV